MVDDKRDGGPRTAEELLAKGDVSPHCAGAYDDEEEELLIGIFGSSGKLLGRTGKRAATLLWLLFGACKG
jgi:hypothetical protein